ncbi:MAG TPA: hypothetical protein VF552_09405 [Allosphingosinicella sp.]|jgi:hypothetical protein
MAPPPNLLYSPEVPKRDPGPAAIAGGKLQTKHLAIATGAAFVLTLLFIGMFAILSRGAPPASQTAIVVAMVALVGTLWTGAVTLTGIFLKDAVDRRTALYQAESERRLRMETALKAVELMSKAEAEGAPLQESREAAILVVASLNHLRLALTLARQFWQRGKISSAGFVHLVDECLESADAALQTEATYSLRMNAAKLVAGPNHFDFPERQMLQWTGTLPRAAKENFLLALVGALVSQDRSYWERGIVNWVLYALYKVMLAEPELRFRCFAALVSRELCELLKSHPGDGIFPPDRDLLTYEEIRKAAEDVLGSIESFDNVVGTQDHALYRKLTAWNAGTDAPPAPETGPFPSPAAGAGAAV